VASEHHDSLPHEKAAEEAGWWATLKPHVDRLLDDLISRDWIEASHSLLNIPTEHARAFPQLSGRVWFWQTLATVVVVIVVLAA